MKRTKTKLISSITVLIVCFAMLIGSTFAWFTDSTSTGVNKIQAGNLDIELYHSSTGEPNEIVNNQTELFQIDSWEPGVCVYENFSIKNEGSLALKYTLDFNLDTVSRNYVVEKDGDTITGTERSLADVLYVKISNGVLNNTRPILTASEGVLLSDFLVDGQNYLDTGALEAGGIKNISVIIYWPESLTDNQYNLKNGWFSSTTANETTNDGKNKLSIQLPILLSATQYTSEYDSFGNDYDREPGIQPPYDKPVSTSSAPVKNNAQTELNTDKGSVIIPEDSNLPEDTVAHLEIIEVEEANVNLTVTDDTTVVSYEVELVDQNGDKISLVDVQDRTLLARVEVGYGLDENKIKVFRDGTTELTVLKYEDGYVYFESDHFCDVDVLLPDVVARVGNTYFYNYEDATAIVFAGSFIDGIIDVDSMKEAIIAKYNDKYVVECDYDNHTITLKGSVAKIGSVTFDSVESAFEAANDGDIIILVDNGTCAKINISNKNLIFDLNGFILENSGRDGFYLNNSILTLRDSSTAGTGTINHSGAWDLADANSNGKLVIESGTYTTLGSYGILYPSDSQYSGIIGGKFNTEKVACAEGYDVEFADGWYVPQRYYLWIDFAAGNFRNIDEENKTVNINCAEELALLAKEVNDGNNYSGWTFNLDNNINLSGRRWTPIGTEGKPFKGIFNGNGYKISNTLIKNVNGTRSGLFGQLESGKILNVSLDNIAIYSKLDIYSNDCIGGLVGQAYTGVVDNIYISNLKIVGTAKYVGGITGHGYASISNCYVNGLISPSNAVQVGGIIGLQASSDLKNCYVNATIDVLNSIIAGGIIGFSCSPEGAKTVANCYFAGQFLNTKDGYYGGDNGANVGGIVGFGYGYYGTKYKVINCFTDSNIKNNQMIVANCGGDYGTNEMFEVNNCSWSGDFESYVYYGYQNSENNYEYDTITRSNDCSFTEGMTYQEFVNALNLE